MEMKVNTAISLSSLAVILILMTQERTVSLLIMKRSLGAFVALISALTLYEYMSGKTLAIDEFLIKDDLGDHVGPPGRPSVGTATCLLLMTIATFMLTSENRYFTKLGEALVGLGLAIGSIGLVGYIYSVNALYSVPFFSTMALHTSFCLILLPVGFLAIKERDGFFLMLFKSSPGGYVARHGLGWIVGVTLFTGFVFMLGEQMGHFDAGFSVIAIASLSILFTLPVIIWMAWSLDKLDHEKHLAAVALTRQQELNSWQSDFIAFVTHEFRTPMANIDSAAQILTLKGEIQKPETLQKHVRQIKREIKNMNALITNFLSIAKHER
jgi:hypothetical protein